MSGPDYQSPWNPAAGLDRFFLRIEPLNMRPPFLAAIILACSLWGIMAGSALADDPENDLGSWVNANSTVRFSDRWSVFAQAEVRVRSKDSILRVGILEIGRRRFPVFQ